MLRAASPRKCAVNDLLSGSSASAALLLAALALLPLALITLTSFAKIAVVLSALRNALGAPDVPSGAVVTALALALSVYVMAPVFERIEVEATKAPSTGVAPLLAAAREPLVAFLARHAGADEKRMFVELAKEQGRVAAPTDLAVLWPSFALSEMKRAFQLGFYLFLPFLALDLVVAQVLLALGVSGLDPSRVALPFKLLLFVSVNGFMLLARALVLAY
jgi:type III secretion protein R